MKNADIERGWELEDIETHARNYPGTFVALPPDVRDAIQPGRLVKLAFTFSVDDDAGAVREAMERMWVKVTHKGSDSYEGLLDNDAVYSDYMVAGAEVIFEPRHIIEVWADES